MTAILRVESRRLLRGTVVLTAAFVLLTVFMLAVFPSMAEEAEALEAAFPDYVMGLFGFEEMHTIEGFTASYIFPFLWTLFVGVFFAYVAGGMIAGDVRSRRLDLTLSNPVSRESVLLQKLAALWLPLVVINGVLFLVILGGSLALDETIDPVMLALTHLYSVPYVLVCAAIGLLCSVTLDRSETAQAGAVIVVFVLWLVEGLSEMDPDLEWVGDLTPSRYFDPAAVLIHDEVPLLDSAILLVAFVVLTGLAVVLFIRRDI